jgi:tyrosyl-tRNA synthetase
LVNALATILGSKSEAKRLIGQGGVDINGEKAKNPNIQLNSGDKINLGKKRFLKVK